MKDWLVWSVKKFLEAHVQKKSPLLLGLSGGEDSLALLHILVECKVPLILAHVDHGWRKESAGEAKTLQALAKKLNIPFHLHRLKKPQGDKGNNLEARARDERLKFFHKLYDQFQCEALLLAHHADDLAETILKRVLEGAHFTHMAGMRPVSLHEGMHVWRPLLQFSKEEIREWSHKKGLKPFLDPTNKDSRFLRARMREEILPRLARSFGKEVSSSLLKLGKSLDEIGEYLEKKVAPHLQVVRDATGARLTFPKGLESLEKKMLVRHFLKGEGIALPASTLEDLCHSLDKKGARRAFGSSEKKVYVLNNSVFVPEKGAR